MVLFSFILLLTSSTMMILCSHTINSVLFLVLSFLSASSICFSLGCSFIGIVFVLIYLGAIVVLFLFIVMMVQIKNSEVDETTYLFIGILIVFAFFIQVLYIMMQISCLSVLTNIEILNDRFSFINENLLDANSNDSILTMGTIMYDDFFFFLIIISMLLLLGMVGSIYLTNYKTGFSIINQYNQVDRNNKLISILFRS